MTYAKLLEELKKFTPEQLETVVTCSLVKAEGHETLNFITIEQIHHLDDHPVLFPSDET